MVGSVGLALGAGVGLALGETLAGASTAMPCAGSKSDAASSAVSSPAATAVDTEETVFSSVVTSCAKLVGFVDGAAIAARISDTAVATSTTALSTSKMISTPVCERRRRP